MTNRPLSAPARLAALAAALVLAACASGPLPPPDPALARHLAAVERALAAAPPDLAEADRQAAQAAARAVARQAAGQPLGTIAASVTACRDGVAAVAHRAVDERLLALSAVRETCRLAAATHALLGGEPAHAHR
ncbi:MAG: hypothetical protein ACK4MT_08160 [Thermaurantiacus tibetensis]|uniref:hypothetical protein n=1 Tax=Thermaurantiacus tibetensis TaxID=2759035 RepID=UPI00188FD6C1|nr:hypothetical protein [Thermaurantiacus tibetensis]